MKEVELSKQFILHGKLPLSLSKVNFENVYDFISWNIQDLHERKLNRFKDAHVPLSQDIIWILDYAEAKYQLKTGKTLRRKTHDVMVHWKNEGTTKRHHLNYADLKNSPDIVMLYFIDSDDNDMIIEYDNNRKKGVYWNMPIESNKYVIFNSNLEYYLLPNKLDDQRIVLRVTYDEITPHC